jgi:hypothetical protein
MAQTQRDTSTGNTMEQTVIAVLKSKGFRCISHREWEKAPHNYGSELLLTNVPYRSIYEHNGRTEFLLKSAKYHLEIRIECKWQQTSGSVDEKLPYLYLNCVEAMPEQEIIIVIDGNGWKQGAIKWLKDAVTEKKYVGKKDKTIIHVFRLNEFLTWANTRLR